MTTNFITPEAVHFLRESSKMNYESFFIGVDVGGTNSRVAISFRKAGDFTEPFTLCKFKANTVQALKEGLFVVGNEMYHHNGNRFSSGGCLAVAGRKIDNGNAVEITNYHGITTDRILSKKDLPGILFPPNNVFFLNDLESASYGIIALNSLGNLSKYFKPLWPSDVSVEIQDSPSLVIAAGTGLGVALLHLTKKKPNYEVLPLEFGHVQIGELGPKDVGFEQDEKLRRFLSNKLYQGKYTPEVEDVCSGRGIGYIYEWLTGEASVDAGEISRRAETGDKSAQMSLDLHYRWQIRCAQSLSIGFVAKSVFLAGDNQVHNSTLVEKNVKELHELYLNHPKKHWIENVPVYVQYKTFNINLLGALYFTHFFSQV